MHISSSSPELLTFFFISHDLKIQDDGSRHLVFSVSGWEFDHSGVLIVWHLCSVPNLVQTSVIVTEIDAHSHICFRLSFDDVTRINFRFWLLIMWSSSHGRDASSHIISCKISLSSPKLLIFFRNSRWRPPPSWIFSLCELGHSGVLVVWYLCSVPNLV